MTICDVCDRPVLQADLGAPRIRHEDCIVHGTEYGYAQQRCRCEPCVAAHNAYVVERLNDRKGRLEVECWCGAKVLWVAAWMVRKGITGSCGREGCGPGGAV